MQYKDLPNRNVVMKLSSYAFARAGVDTSVFKFYTGSEDVYQFVTNQLVKIREQNKDQESFTRVATEFLQEKIEFDIPNLDLCEEDFLEDNCRRPDEKTFWLSAIEKVAILRLSALSSEIADS